MDKKEVTINVFVSSKSEREIIEDIMWKHPFTRALMLIQKR